MGVERSSGNKCPVGGKFGSGGGGINIAFTTEDLYSQESQFSFSLAVPGNIYWEKEIRAEREEGKYPESSQQGREEGGETSFTGVSENKRKKKK